MFHKAKINITSSLKKLNKYSLDINCCPKIDFRAILEIFNFKV